MSATRPHPRRQVGPPVWAAIDAGNLAVFPVLAGLEAIIIAEDADETGRQASATLARRYRGAGAEATIVRAACQATI